jgi:uncharacterized protein
MTIPFSLMKKKQLDHTLGKRQQNTLFEEGYRLAFLTRKKTKPWPKICELWKASAINGHIRAQFYLATCYDNGYGVKKNLREAFNWYMKAAKEGKMEAQYNIGFFYKKGDLVKRNFKKAVYWYSLAAKQGAPKPKGI